MNLPNSPEFGDLWKKEKHGVTQSLIGAFRECHFKFHLKANGVYEDDGTYSPAILFGHLFHDSYEYILGKLEQGLDPKQIQRVDYFEYLEFLFKEKFEKKVENVSNRDKVYMAFYKALATIPEYMLKVATKDIEEFEMVSLEEEFSVELPNGEKFRGKTDGLVKRRSTGEYFILEHKTKAQFDEEVLRKWVPIDTQVNMYKYALEKKHGISIKGVIYNIVRNSMMRLGVKDTVDTFIARVRDDVETNPSKYFVRVEVNFDPELHSKVVNDFVFDTEVINHLESENKYYPKNTKACIGAYGACEFLNYCSKSPCGNIKQRSNLFEELEQANSEE
jgi:hypothetical protein